MSQSIADAIHSPPRLGVFDPKECQDYADWLASLWNSKDVAACAAAFTPTAEVEYGALPPIKGQNELRRFLQNRFDGYAAYHVQKTVRLASKPNICIELDVRWSPADSPASMRRTRAIEILTIAESKIVKWEIVSNPHPRKLP